MNNVKCPYEKHAFRAHSDALTPKLAAHINRCTHCQSIRAEVAFLGTLARELPAPVPNPHRMKLLRSAVLSSAANKKENTRFTWKTTYVVAISMLLVTGFVLLTILSITDTPAPQPSNNVFRATIHGHANATFIIVDGQPDEIVRLTHGTITVQVSALTPSERFRVIVGDSEVEVKGTVFDVTAVNDRLEKVLVASGTVIVRHKELGAETLVAGDQWEAAEMQRNHQKNATVTEPHPPPSTKSIQRAQTNRRPLLSSKRTHRHKKSADTAVSPETELAPIKSMSSRIKSTYSAEQAFRQGWESLRKGDAEKAAVWLREACEADGVAAVAEDAAYWLGIAYSQSGEPHKASKALSDFINRYPRSPRTGEAMAILGWLCVKNGEFERARDLFERAAVAPAAKVRKSAARGLQVIEQRSPQEKANK